MSAGYSETPLAKQFGIAEGSPLGLVDNKVCAIDDTWSGLRVVWRPELRAARRG